MLLIFPLNYKSSVIDELRMHGSYQNEKYRQIYLRPVSFYRTTLQEDGDGHYEHFHMIIIFMGL